MIQLTKHMRQRSLSYKMMLFSLSIGMATLLVVVTIQFDLVAAARPGAGDASAKSSQARKRPTLTPTLAPTPTPSPSSTSTPTPTPTPSSLPTPTPDPLATHYVSPAGSDANPGTQAQPWKSFSKAAATAQAGDVVVFMDGVYVETQTTKVLGSGMADQPIIFRSLNPLKAKLYYQNMRNKWRVEVVGKPYIQIEDFEITGDNAFGSSSDKFINLFDGSDYAVIKGNKIHHIYEDLIKIHNSDHVLVENNDLYDVQNEALDVVLANAPILRGNTVTNAHRQAFMIKGGTRNAQIYNNKVIQDSGSLYVAFGLGGSTDSIYSYDPSGWEGYHQVAWNNIVVAKNGAVIMEALKFEGCDTCAFFNNVVVGADHGMVAYDGPGRDKAWNVDVHVRNPTYQNNIFVDCKKPVKYFPDTILGVTTIDYNLFFNCSGVPAQPHPVVGNPLFVDKLSDWHLQAASPAIGSGVNIAPFPTFIDANTPSSSPIDASLDYDGQPRVEPWSLGVYR